LRIAAVAFLCRIVRDRKSAGVPRGFKTAILASPIKTQPIEVRHVADEPAHWSWKSFDECWRRNDLVGARHLGSLTDIDHFQCAAIFKFGSEQLADA
jgi:hypothetical protein